MRNACRHTLVLLVISAVLLAPTLAGAYDLTYSGELPATEGGTGYGDNEMWDYVYNLTYDMSGPDVWGIQVDYAPVQNSIDQPSNWNTGQWSSSVDHADLPGLTGLPGIVWERDHYDTLTGPFSFQSTFEPGTRFWQADGLTTTSSGTEWSASPEPASLLLSSLALLGVGYWRRRKTT